MEGGHCLNLSALKQTLVYEIVTQTAIKLFIIIQSYSLTFKLQQNYNNKGLRWASLHCGKRADSGCVIIFPQQLSKLQKSGKQKNKQKRKSSVFFKNVKNI